MAKVKIPLRRTVGTFFVSLFVGSGTSAQESADAEDAADSIEEVIVTGSRIPRDSFNLSMPMISVGAEAITDAGLGSLAEILIDEVPSLYESISHTNSQSQVSNTGVTSMNLRRLGSSRTLN